MSFLADPVPPGLLYFPNWISDFEHDQLLQGIDGRNFETSLARRVQHYGARYHYDSSQVAEIGSAPPIPEFLTSICERLYRECDFERMPEQVIVNEYLGNQGIAAHVDRNTFGPKVATISLIESWYMKFRNLDGNETIDVLLETNSLAIMTNESRSTWSHEIKKVKTDKVAGLKKDRGRRISITLRTINNKD
jgi:alkylated DNA repair dioxygenase AlkB